MEGTIVSEGTTASDPGQDQMPSEEREKLERVLSGSLENLPALSSKIVRIFTSSTFTGKHIIYFIFGKL